MASDTPRGRLTILGNGAVAAIGLLIVMFAVYAAHEPSALSLFGIGNLLNNAIVLALAATGLTLVVVCGELDLSGPGVIAIANVVVATVSGGDAGALGSFGLVLLVGLVVGGLNGILVAYFGLQSLAVTLGSLIACQGIALLILPAPGGEVVESIAYGITGDILRIPVPAILLVLVLVFWFLLKHSRMGIAMYAVGTDQTAARLSGLNIRATRLFAFVAAGLFYAMAGFVFSAEIGSGDPRISDSFLLFMFAAVAIGGTSLFGGRGGVVGTLAGAGILTVLQKMLFALGVADFYTNIFNGLIMILAILFGQASVYLARRSARREA
ncbi:MULTISPECIES: ABC transporter permease [unclassified Mesorhizobium]|uniref:ABC transporter permease n=2 Tax=Mesorhizobium TaxID=68287 RepID=UPI00112CDA99|nr:MULTISPECIES: ABC transporter permease [unclassified Mesorhizobium]TPJ46032.1 ABC transporter permease [Mesorhizobium sp. B2-6-6]TPL38985.1 ABC transporter permease [Mesorhizobium sp. B2-4-5]MCA0008526.1 ABC transporter permease [Mesorhizobium sp. B264B1B]MCA0018876.1 ABC transporter permease [Mesorhizobium sp. B264B1A]MCA0025745.1 ABC transporter permease [Mesorhizobium sp. B263B1A]